MPGGRRRLGNGVRIAEKCYICIFVLIRGESGLGGRGAEAYAQEALAWEAPRPLIEFFCLSVSVNAQIRAIIADQRVARDVFALLRHTGDCPDIGSVVGVLHVDTCVTLP